MHDPCSDRAIVRTAATLLLAFLVFAPSRASALVVLSENSTSSPIAAEACDGATSGVCILECHRSCDEVASNRVEIGIHQCVFGLPVGSREVVAYIQTDIEIGATPQTRGNLIATQFSYDIWWSGTWCLAGTLTSFKEGRVDVWLDVYERATPNLIFREQVHSMDIQADFGFFEGLVGAGGGDDEGSRVGSFTVILRRGQQYTVRLTLRGRTDLGIAVGYIGLNYDDNDKGAGWNDLRVTVGQDARGVVAGLQAQIDSLRTDFERHGHVYLTGRGEGHNNTEAETSRPIYFEEMEETPAFLEDQEKRVPLPIRSALFGSAPNPVAGVSTIRYELPVASQVSIRLYNVHGQVVRTLVDDPRPPGRHETELDASGLAAGVYFYSLRTPQYFETRKVVISK